MPTDAQEDQSCDSSHHYGVPNKKSNSSVSAELTPGEASGASSFVAGDGGWRAGPPSKDPALH